MVQLVAMSLLGSTAWAAPSHSVSLRYRAGYVPNGIVDIWYFNADDEGAEPYERPKIKTPSFGLEYGLAMHEDGGTTFAFWAERMSIKMDGGYWDDIESPAEHWDGDWLEAENLGMWAIGANYAHEIPLSSTDKPLWVGAMLGGGLGMGLTTGRINQWHFGFHEEVVDPSCGPEDLAYDRYQSCAVDKEGKLPAVLPIIDVTASVRLHIVEHVLIRLDLGYHDTPYAGVAGGGAF